MHLKFEERKATQAAAYILKKRGGTMHYIKLLKLLYLIDRESLLRYGQPVTGDDYYSMEYGPNLSAVDDFITSELKSDEGLYWKKYIRSAPDYSVSLLKEEIENDELSESEIELINEIYNKYGYMNRWRLIDDVMHKLPEWEDPCKKNRQRITLEYRDILLKNGKTESETAEIENDLETYQLANTLLGDTVAPNCR